MNEKETNAWGMPRGYVIQSGVTTAQLLPPQHPLTKGTGCGYWGFECSVGSSHD